MNTTPQAALLSDDEIIDIRKLSKPTDPAKAWGDTIALARGLEAAIIAKLQATQAEPTIPGLTKEQFGYALHCAQVVDAATSEIARLRSENAVLNERLDATQEPVQSVPEAMKVVTEAVRSDPDYAWSWHCSVAMASVDEGMGHYEANQAAARFMLLLAGVDTTKHQGFPEAPKKEPVQAGELPDEREAFEAEMRCVEEWGHRSLKKRTNGKYENWQVALMWDVWQARSALSARKPLTNAQIERLFYNSNRGNGCASLAAFVRVVRLVESAHGIGLEVKP